MDDGDYKTEKHLVEDLKSSLTGQTWPLLIEESAHEFYYRNGRVDVIAISKKGDLIAFEAKLEKWRVALHQAYRNSSFAHFSYVVLPNKTIKKALKWSDKFTKYGIGLCSIKNSRINIVIKSRRNETILPWLTQSAVSYISESSDALTGECC